MAVYRLSVLLLLVVILVILLDHGVSVDVLLSGFLRACAPGLAKP